MAPAIPPRSVGSSSQHLHSISRSVSSSFATLTSTPKDNTSIAKTPLVSIFAIILRGVVNFSKRTLLSSPSRRNLVEPVFLTPRTSTHDAITYPSLQKRQNQVLAIPTTYAGLNAGPQPGALVGIVLGSIAGFILILYILLTLFRLRANQGGEVVEEKIIRHRRRASRSSPTSRSASRVVSERASPPRRERVVREEETVIVEEHMDPSVEDDDIVEVIEEHSPERPARKPSGRSGFRTVDPAEFGGGRGPMRKVSRR